MSLFYIKKTINNNNNRKEEIYTFIQQTNIKLIIMTFIVSQNIIFQMNVVLANFVYYIIQTGAMSAENKIKILKDKYKLFLFHIKKKRKMKITKAQWTCLKNMNKSC